MATFVVKIKDIEDIYASDLSELLQLAAGAILDQADGDDDPAEYTAPGEGSNDVATVTWKVK